MLPGGDVAVQASGGGVGVLGIERCGRIWLCGRCQQRVSAVRTADTVRALEWAQNQGYAIGMVTLTAAHAHDGEEIFDQDIGALWDTLAYGWRYATSGRAWSEQREHIVGYVRGTEVTVDDYRHRRRRTGVHIHFHAVFVVQVKDGQTHREAIQPLAELLQERWEKGLAKRDLVSVEDAFDLSIVGENGLRASDLGTYIAKGDRPAADLGREVAGGWAKDGKSGRTTPLGLLETLDPQTRGLTFKQRRAHLAIWAKYEAAVHGRRALTWSRELRDLAGLEPELDDQAANDVEEETPEDVGVLLLPVHLWNEHENSIRTLASTVADERRTLKVISRYLASEGVPYAWSTRQAYLNRIKAHHEGRTLDAVGPPRSEWIEPARPGAWERARLATGEPANTPRLTG